MIVALVVVVCGGTAAILRFLVDAAIEAGRLGEFPWGTLAVNLGGTFALGLLAGLGASHRTMLLLGTATIGSYTTFSTWMLESHRPAEEGEPRLAWATLVVGLLTGLVAIVIGRALGKVL